MPGKIKYRDLSDKHKQELLGDFYKIVGFLCNHREAKDFFQDLLSYDEVVMLARRIQIAKLLMKGWTHAQVRNKLRVGWDTISRVDRWLNKGTGGYAKILKKAGATTLTSSQNIRSGRIRTPFSLDDVRYRYPAHFALLNLLMDGIPQSAKNRRYTKNQKR